MCFLYLLLLYVFCICFEADRGVAAEGGIVKQYLEDGNTPVNTTPLKTLSPDGHTQYLECFYEHKFEYTKETTDANGIKLERQHRHVFFLQCIKEEPSQDAYLFVFFNALPIERLAVTSCNKDAVQQSIFPPRPDYVMNRRYDEVYKRDNDHLELTPHLMYKDVSGECYQRLYSVEHDKRLGRFELKDRKGKTSLSGAECGYVQFSCQAPSTELKHTVIGVANRDRTAPLSLDLISEPGTTKQLVCTVPLPGPETSDFSYELICVKTRKPPGTQEDGQSSGDMFFAFVNYGSSNILPLVTFNVKSCMEDDIVNGIFPDRLEYPGIMGPRIHFKYNDGLCYDRQYTASYDFVWNRNIVCPSGVLDWVHPSIETGAVMWLSCKGPTSASGEPKTFP